MNSQFNSGEATAAEFEWISPFHVTTVQYTVKRICQGSGSLLRWVVFCPGMQCHLILGFSTPSTLNRLGLDALSVASP